VDPPLQYSDTAYWTHVYHIETLVPHTPLTYWMSEKKTFCCQLQVYVQLITQQYESATVKKNFYNQKSHMKITDDFYYKWKPSCAYHKISTFCGEWKWMECKGGPWLVHDECIICTYNGMAKGTSWAEVTLNSKKIKPTALAIVELHESEGIS